MIPFHSTHPHPRAVVLLSGGLDSATCLAIARAAGDECHALTIAYGQRHQVELAAAERIAHSLGAASHKVMSIDLRAFGGSALTDDHLSVPKGAAPQAVPARRDTPHAEIPITYVPARNTIFLSYALAWAEVLGAARIYIGVNAVDYSGYPDCRPDFINAFQRMADLATKAGVSGYGPRILAPLINLTKAQIIQRGTALNVNYALTTSCYDPDPTTGKPCTECDSCRLRAAGFKEAGIRDPALSLDASK
ncbi:MAG TPA: 7-cyano-7-deazaguanine synthase QueC [Phycisphaerales bacterium]|nr:7-cyano-7-deazaguanine synthase QueC [Phycisphaerales bacterium]